MLPASQTELTARSLWNVVYLTAEGASRRFYYDAPRQGPEAVGVKRGTLLFEGRKDGDQYSGTAYFFSKQCGQRPYAVTRSVASGISQITITMSDQVPRLGANCQQIGVHNEVLVFSYKANASAIDQPITLAPLNRQANGSGTATPASARPNTQAKGQPSRANSQETIASAGSYGEGRLAYIREDYTAAMRILKPLAEQGDMNAPNSWSALCTTTGMAYR